MNPNDALMVFINIILYAVPWIAGGIVIYMFYNRLKDEPTVKKIWVSICKVVMFIILFFGRKKDKKKEDDF